MKRSLKELIVVLAIVCLVTFVLVIRQVRETRQIVVNTTTIPLISEGSFPIPITTDDYVLGNRAAPLTFVLFADLSNKQSRELYQIVKEIVNNNPKKARLVWKDLPGAGIIRDRKPAHQVAYCAGQQNKFWVYVDELMKERLGLKEKNLFAAGERVNIDVEKINTCLESGASVNRINETAQLAANLVIRTPPSLFANNKRVNVNANVDLKQMLSSFVEE